MDFKRFFGNNYNLPNEFTTQERKKLLKIFTQQIKDKACKNLVTNLDENDSEGIFIFIFLFNGVTNFVYILQKEKIW